jgi:hypothetical protein
MVWIYLSLGIMLLLLIIGILSGCSVVKTNYSTASKKEATVYYYLPESLIKIRSLVKIAVMYNEDDSTLNGSTRIIEQSFTATTEMIADTKDLLALNYKPNALMSDDIKYAVNAKGLLETVNITTEDRTADIIAKLAEAPQTIFGISGGASKAPGIILKIKEYSADFAIKASSVKNTADTIPWNIIVTNELGKEEYLSIAGDFHISSADAVALPKTLAQIISAGSSSSEEEVNGILTRPIKNMQLSIQSTLGKGLPVNIVIADITKLITIPVNRTAFVKRVNKIGIADGIILSNEITKPSSVEGFVSIPINVAKAIVSIPGQLVTFKIDNTKRLNELEKEKLNLEKTLRESQKFSLSKESEIEKVKLEIQKASQSNDIELKKLQLELSKSLLDAEKNQLESLKALEEIKREIEKLKEKK